MVKDIIYGFIALLLLVLSIVPMFDGGVIVNMFGVSDSSSWYTCITYLFIHSNILHFVINALMFAQMDLFFFTYIHNDKLKHDVYAISLLLAILYPIAFSNSIPTVGLSGFLFGVFGYVCSNLSRRNILFNMFVVAVYTALGIIVGVTNYMLHICCFSTTFIAGGIIRYAGKRR